MKLPPPTFVLVAACGGSPSLPGVDRVRPDDRGADAAVDAREPPDPGRPRPDDDTDVPPPPPIYADLSAALDADPIPVDPGDPMEPRWSEHAPALWGDLDDDGVPELVAWAPGRAAGTPGAVVRVLRWVDGGLVADPVLTAALDLGRATLVAVVDLDRDGHTDLVAADPLDGVRWGEPGGWGPWTPTASSPVLQRGVLAAALVDLDDDGWTDLVHGGVGCRTEPMVSLRVGPRAFTLATDLLATGKGPFQADAILATRREDGRPWVYAMHHGTCSPIYPNPGFYAWNGRRPDGFPRFAAVDPTPADVFWRQDPRWADAPIPRLAPMGAGLEDLDHDGWLDLVVTLGVPDQAVWFGSPTGFVDGSLASGLTRDAAPNGFPTFPWSVAFPDVDLDGRPELLLTIGDDAGSFMSLGGWPMRSAIYAPDAARHFVDHAEAWGLPGLGSWRSLDLADPDGDGDAEIALGGFGNGPRVAGDRRDHDPRAMSLRLVGTTSDPLAIGARVVVSADDLPTRTLVWGGLGNPYVAHPTPLFVARAEAPVTATVHWPSGLVTAHPLDGPGAHVLTEPAVLVVGDADRTAPADGASTIVAHVRPHDAAGRPAPDLAVEARLEGAGTLTVEADADGARLVATAPATAGDGLLVVTVDGQELRVRPRLRWR